MAKVTAVGTRKEQDTFNVVNQHYKIALEDTENRYTSWDRKVELFWSYINESGWPYSSQVFVPQTFTALFEKMARLNGGKPRGRLIPREGGDVMKAKINNELLNFQWDDVTRIEHEPMTAKWAKMDLNARIYGASFAIAKWRYEVGSDGGVRFDGPTMKVLNNRDVLPNPAYSSVKNWFQYREYLTIRELENVNDVCGEKPKYKNIKQLRNSILTKNTRGGDQRQSNYNPKFRSLQGLSDYLGTDEDPDFKIIEVITEYRDDRIIVFAPKHGVILRDDANPYKHEQIPVITLKYIPIDDDIYGMSEIEPVEKVQKAMNALSSQFVDSINMDLYRILHVAPTEVQMHTLEWGPGKKWLMNRPGQSVVPMEHSAVATNQFVNVYTVLTQMFKEAMGEASAAYSSLKPFGSEKTATEIQETSSTRSVRDNFNQIFLSEAIKEQMMFWHLMNKQFIFADPEKEAMLVRVIGRDSMNDFKKLSEMVPDTSDLEMEGAIESISAGGEGEVPMTPAYPVAYGGQIFPKFDLDESGEIGTLYMTPEDMVGSYDYIADVQPMRANSDLDDAKILTQMFGMAINPATQQLLAQEGKKINISELLLDVFEASGKKGAEKYFDVLTPQNLQEGGMNGIPTDQGGAGAMPQGGGAGGPQTAGGMANPQGMVGAQSVPYLG